MTPAMRSTPQGAVIMLQHIINMFSAEPDTIYLAACAIADIATEAAENRTIVDPLMGSNYESPAAPATGLTFDASETAIILHGLRMIQEAGRCQG